MVIVRLYRCIAVAVFACILCSCGGSRERKLDREDGYDALENELAGIVDSVPGQVGIAIIINNKDSVTLNNTNDYPLMSMFKLHEAIAVCHTLDMHSIGLDSAITLSINELDKDTWSPMLKDYTTDIFSVSVKSLLDYTLVSSDNNASNILFDKVVSVGETDDYIHTLLPENDFCLVYKESEMKEDINRSYINCSSPLSYATLVDRLFTDSIVSKEKQDFIKDAMSRCDTGMSRIAAGLPAIPGISFAHRTGSGYVDSLGRIIAVNDGGYVAMPSGVAYSIAVFIKDFYGTQEDAENVIARISATAFRYLAE